MHGPVVASSSTRVGADELGQSASEAEGAEGDNNKTPNNTDGASGKYPRCEAASEAEPTIGGHEGGTHELKP